MKTKRRLLGPQHRDESSNVHRATAATVIARQLAPARRALNLHRLEMTGKQITVGSPCRAKRNLMRWFMGCALGSSGADTVGDRRRLEKQGRMPIVVWGAACGFMISAVALSQTPESSNESELKEIVVTAQRRAENLQDVPVSAQVISGETLSLENLNTLESVADIIPSVHIGQNGRTSDMYIRGVGSGENQALDQSVGTFVDDIYHGRSRLTVATWLDLEQIEVLKGPQTTFFGNNAIAGAFNITTRKPGDEFELSARMLYGQFDQYAVEGAVNVPLSSVLAMRVAAIGEGTNGWLDAVNLDEHLPRDRNAAGRAALSYRPTIDFDATLKIEVSTNRRTGAINGQITDCPPSAPFVASGWCQMALAEGVPVGISTNQVAPSPGQLQSLDTGEYVLTMNYYRWGQTFTSVTGYYDYRFNENLDSDAQPATLFNIQAPENYGQFSEELRIQSSADQPLEYLGGAYFQHDNLRFNQAFSFFFLTPALESSPPFAPLVPYLPLAQNTTYSQAEDIYSVFASLSWKATDKWTLSAALRGSTVHKSYNWNLIYGTATQDYGGVVPLPDSVASLPPLLGLGNPNTLSGSRDDQALMPSASIQYQISPMVMSYFSYTRGFKAGGFNGADTTGVASNLPYGPEHVNAYEAGIKSTWLDRRLIIDADVFRSDYTDLQVTTDIPSTGGTYLSLLKNAAASRSQGLEIDGQWIATQSFRLSSDITYLDAYYIHYPNVTATQLQMLNGLATQDLSGQPTQYSPKWSGSLTASYRASVSAGFSLVAELSWLFSSPYFLSGNDDPILKQGSYDRLDARLTLEPSGGRWAVDLIGSNLTDRTILTNAFPYTFSPGSTYAIKEQVRSVAVQVRYRFQ